MRNGCGRLVFLMSFIIVSLMGPSISPAAQLTKLDDRPAVQALKECVTAYYRAVQAGNLNAALQLVASESKDDFFHTNYTGLVDFRIADVSVSEKDDAATLSVWLTQKIQNFPQLLDRKVNDTWKLIDGQWCIVLPSTKEIDTPFGKMKTGGQGQATGAQGTGEIIRKREKNIDPDQYMIALQKAARKTNEAKPEEKQPVQSQDDKAKRQD
jgi:hypothetical protein